MSNIIDLPPNSKSGLYKAPSHDEGGVRVIVDNQRVVEVEGGEIHLCKTVLQQNKEYDFKGKTNKEMLDAIFQDNHCVFEQGKAKSLDFIICKLVVGDKKKRDLKGTAKEIINALQSEKSCKVTEDAADTYNNRLGGVVADVDEITKTEEAVEMYQEMLSENPNDKEAKEALEMYQEMLDELNIKNKKEDSVIYTKEFKDWFGDSKVVDKDGKPMIYYHGTFNSAFNKFDIKKVGEANLYGRGFYFTDDKDVAIEYSAKCEIGNADKNERRKWTDTVKKIIIPENQRKDFFERYEKLTVQKINKDYIKEYTDFLNSIKDEFLKTGKLILFYKNDLSKSYSDGMLSCSDFKELIESKLYKDFNFDFLDSDVKEVYLSIKNPFDLEQPATDKDVSDLISYARKYAIDHKWIEKKGDEVYVFWWKHLFDEFRLPDDKKFKFKWIKSVEKYAISMDNYPIDLKFVKEMWQQILNFREQYPEPFEYTRKDEEGKDITSTYGFNIPIRKDKKMTWANLFWILTDSNWLNSKKDLILGYFKSKGYDGVYHLGGWNIGVKPHDVYIAFEPNQIKYANGLNTKFNPDNDDMRYAKGGKIKFLVEDEDEDGDRIKISIKDIGEVTLVISYPKYEFQEDLTEKEFDELGLDEEEQIGKIEHIEVVDKEKGKGYAKLLMNKAIQVAKKRNLFPLYLNASPMGNKGLYIDDLTEFYKSFGFKVFKRQGGNNLMLLDKKDVMFIDGGGIGEYKIIFYSGDRLHENESYEKDLNSAIKKAEELSKAHKYYLVMVFLGDDFIGSPNSFGVFQYSGKYRNTHGIKNQEYAKGGDIKEKEIMVEVFENIGIFNTDYSTVYFADKKGGFSYPEVKIINEHDVLEYKEPLPHSVVLVFNEKESLTPDYIQINEIKFAVVPEPMVRDIKPIFDKHGVKFVSYDAMSSNNLKEIKLNAVKSLLK